MSSLFHEKADEIKSRCRDELSAEERRMLYGLKDWELDLVVTLVKRAYRAAMRDMVDEHWEGV